jgi:hypothetical protein
MNIIVVQLSDIHLSMNKPNPLISRTEKLAAAVAAVADDCEYMVAIVTGDIAFSGHEKEYLIALSFFEQLNSQIERARTGHPLPLRMAIIPVAGNHDCDFSVERNTRMLVLRGLQGDSSCVDESVVRTCVETQAAFDDFVRILRERGFCPWPTQKGLLHESYAISIGPYSIDLTCYNSAWCSVLREKPGTLVPPIAGDMALRAQHATISIAAFHHPYNWFTPEGARQFKSKIEETHDFVLTGHEHSSSGRQISGLSGEELMYVEAAALQDSDNAASSGFHAFLIDLATRKQRYHRFVLEDNTYTLMKKDNGRQNGELSWAEFPINRRRNSALSQFSENHQTYLEDAGVNVWHRSASRPRLSQIYVPPDATQIGYKPDVLPRTIRSAKLLDHLIKGGSFLVTGDNYSGKTSLAKMLCQRFRALECIPLLLQPTKRIGNAGRLKDALSAAFESQYQGSQTDFFQTPREKRVVLLDDFERIAVIARDRENLVTWLQLHSDRVLLFANDLQIDLADLTNPQDHALQQLRLQPFGYLNRHDLIERWVGADPDEKECQIARRTAEVTRTIDQVLGRGFIPAYPVYILAVLQASEASIPIEASISTHGYYYELLIRAELLKDTSSKDYDVLTGYLAFVAYQVFTEGAAVSGTGADYQRYHNQYQERYDIMLSYDGIMSNLTKRNILQCHNDLVKFRYKYIYYYFVATYLRDHLDDNEVRETVRRLASTTERAENADILIFLAHVSKAPFIVESLLEAAGTHYADCEAVRSFSEFPLPSGIEELIDRVAYEDRDVTETRRQLAAERDDAAVSNLAEDAEVESLECAFEPIRKLNASLRTLQVLGQVLKNYPGHLKAETKLALAKAAFSLGGRTWCSVFSAVRDHSADIASQLLEVLRAENPNAGPKALGHRARQAMRMLSFLACLGFVRRVADAIGAPELAGTYDRLSELVGGEMLDVVRAAISLEHSTTTPEGEVLKVYERIRRQPLPSWILRQTVLQHFAIFHVDASTKQRICRKLDIDYKSGLGSSSRTKMLPSRED